MGTQPSTREDCPLGLCTSSTVIEVSSEYYRNRAQLVFLTCFRTLTECEYVSRGTSQDCKTLNKICDDFDSLSSFKYGKPILKFPNTSREVLCPTTDDGRYRLPQVRGGFERKFHCERSDEIVDNTDLPLPL